MKKLGIIILGVFAMTTTTATAEAQSASPEPVYFPFNYGSLLPGSACTEEELEQGMGEEECVGSWEAEWDDDWNDDWASETTYELDGDSRGCDGTVCDYTGGGTEITCTVPGGSDEYIIVGMHDSTPDLFIMCEYNDGAGGWDRIGWCTRSTIDEVYVYGSSSSEAIAFIKSAQNDPTGTDCDFKAYSNQFVSHLEMRGQGGCDYIYGSQYSDEYLEGEYVEGYEYTDYIHLDNDSLGCVSDHPRGYGGKGSDYIYGTSSGDYVYADIYGVSSGAGTDRVYVYGDDDLVDLGYGSYDIAYGGDRDDSLWGGPGDYDEVQGDDGNDTLYGGAGTGDVCNGGSGTDACEDLTCNTKTSCESVF